MSSDAKEKSSSSGQALVCSQCGTLRKVQPREPVVFGPDGVICGWSCEMCVVMWCTHAQNTCVWVSGALCLSVVFSQYCTFTLLHFRSCSSEPWENRNAVIRNNDTSCDVLLKRAAWRLFLPFSHIIVLIVSELGCVLGPFHYGHFHSAEI